MRYGVPYKGSKNQIAEWVCSHFPKATNFYDLFAGGCAITQIVLMKSKYKNYFCNDIDLDGILLFMNAIYGKYQNESRWISREDFIVLKNKDPYIKYCWSFGNNGRDYLYSKEIEPYKKTWHYAIYFNDFSLAEKLGVDLQQLKDINDIREKYISSKNIIKNCVKRESDGRRNSIAELRQMESLNRLQSLQSLQSLQLSNCSYENVKIYKDSVVYCDLPYYNTNPYGDDKSNNFDYEGFYKWALRQKELVVISEYTMPEEFICIDAIEKSVQLCSGSSKKAIEKLFIPKHQKELYNNLMKRR